MEGIHEEEIFDENIAIQCILQIRRQHFYAKKTFLTRVLKKFKLKTKNFKIIQNACLRILQNFNFGPFFGNGGKT